MQTSLPQSLLNTRVGQHADQILRSCVHCGFCTATCPTYQLLGDELDSPRGRIYLIKQFLEGEPVSRLSMRHLDRCLTCRACESTCPSGVQYAQLLDIGRELMEKTVQRPTWQRIWRRSLSWLFPHPKRFAWLLKTGQWLRPVFPTVLKRKVPVRQTVSARVSGTHRRKMLILEGCVQSVATPATNAAAARVLDRLGISLISPAGQGCCGAVDQHLARPESARAFMRRNIDAWWPHIEQGIDSIIVSASGCGVLVKEYGHLLENDARYADKAARVSRLARDLSEVIAAEDLSALQINSDLAIAYQAPCTLQHGQNLPGSVEQILSRLGFRLTQVMDSHLCCGSAGTYSILQAKMSAQLLHNKLQNLLAGDPEMIVTANVGCQLHLQSATDVPVKHWIELLAD